MSTGGPNHGKILKRADPSTIQDKFIVGYQGWFTCAGDGAPIHPGHHGWLHWFNQPLTVGGRPNTDLWPDVSSYSPSELFPVPGLKHKSGEQVFLFSSRHPKTVQRHFNWMAQHGVDGAFLQRFAGQCDVEGGNEGVRRLRDEIGDRVREAAEKEGRVFAIMYDVSGVAPDRIQRIIERDWIHLIREKGILDSPSYLKERGKPVIALWGFGFDNSGHSPNLVRAITSYIRSVTPGGAYIMAGTPAHWRTSVNDADRNPEFLDVWLNEFDAISPWTVGRYRNEDDADRFAETKMKGDVDLLRKRNEEGRWGKVDYIPVVLPGGSGFNLSEGKWGFNDIKRHGGRFLWQQIFNARRQGARIIYGAMWDEYDEGTAFMPAVEKKRLLPESDTFPFMALDEDGFDVPSDWYMRICGFAAEGLRSERRIHESFPSKELQDYWSTRPRYEDVDSKAGHFVSGSGAAGGSGGDDGQSYQDWLAAQKEDKQEPPPPPYSLEAAETTTNSRPQPAQASVPAQPAMSSPVSPAPAPASPAPASSPTQPPQPSFATYSTSSLPSNIDTNTKPSYSNSPGHSSGVGPSQTTFQPSVSTLANDFSRQHISSPDPRPGPIQTVPPPLHPTYPAASDYYSQSQSPPQAHPHLPPNARPHSQSPSHAGPSPGSTAGSGEPQSAGPWSQGQWPPAEWNVSRPPQPQQYPIHQPQEPQKQQQAPSGYPGQGPPAPAAGAGLTRPHSYSASHHPSSQTPLRPHPPMSPPLVRPSTTVPQQPSSHYTGPYPEPTPGNVGRPHATPSSYTPASGGSSYMPGGGPTFPSSAGASSYTPGGPSFPSSPSASSYAPSRPSYPAQGSSYPGQSYPPGPPRPTSPQSPPPTGPYGMPHSQMHPSRPGHTPPQFPQAQGAESYFNTQPPQQQSSYQPSPYSGQHGASYNAPSMPAPNAGIAFPGGPSGPPVPATGPPRPVAYPPYSQPAPSGPSFPTAPASSSAGAFEFALSAVDKVAGKKTREQFETQVGSLAQSGSKLFSKFTK